MKIEHVVMWDGTPGRPMGRMLFCPEPSQQPKGEQPTGETIVGRMRAFASVLRAPWRSARTIAGVVGLTPDQVNHGVQLLCAKGEMERRNAVRKGAYGEQAYRWAR